MFEKLSFKLWNVELRFKVEKNIYTQTFVVPARDQDQAFESAVYLLETVLGKTVVLNYSVQERKMR